MSNFKNQYDQNPDGSLSKVPLCHHAWRYSAQEAGHIDYSKSSNTALLGELCSKETDTLQTERSQGGEKKDAVQNPVLNPKQKKLYV